MLLFCCIIPQVSANTYVETKVNGYTFKVIEYDKNSSLYDIEFFRTQDVETPLKTILKENNAITGVNGIFFCPSNYGFCKGREGTTNNEKYIKWVKYAAFEETGDRVVFAIDENKNPFLFQTNQINPDKEWDIYYGLSNWPLLLKDGEPQTEFYWDKWLIDNKMTGKGTRNFICSNKDWSKIYFGNVFGIDIDTLATTLKDFWCYNALNLDAGYSTAFIYNNRYILGPQRGIVDAIGIVPHFDIHDLDTIAQNITDKILNAVSKKKITKQSELVNKYIKAFNAYRIQIYEKYSQDITTQDEFGNIQKNGYKIDVNDEKWLKIIYIINQVVDYLNQANKSFEKWNGWTYTK